MPAPSDHEMTDWVLLALPLTPPICRKSGAAPLLLTAEAATWSSDFPVGFASNFPMFIAPLFGALGVKG